MSRRLAETTKAFLRGRSMMHYTGVSGRARPFLQNISMASCIPTQDHIGSIHERCLIGIGTFAGNTIDGVFGSQFRYVMSMQVRIRWGPENTRSQELSADGFAPIFLQRSHCMIFASATKLTGQKSGNNKDFVSFHSDWFLWLNG